STESSSASKKTAASLIDKEQTSGSVWLLTLTSRASWRRRPPPQSGHNVYPRYFERKTRTRSLYFFVSSQSKNPRTPAQPPLRSTTARCSVRDNWLKGTLSEIFSALQNSR